MFMTDEFLFYGGIVLVIVSLVGLILYMILARLAILKVRKSLTEEYGEEISRKERLEMRG